MLQVVAVINLQYSVYPKMEIFCTLSKFRFGHPSDSPFFSLSSFAVVVSPPGPVVLRRQKKDSIPQSVFTIPPELDVSLLLEFVG